jgi:hypothetical protein
MSEHLATYLNDHLAGARFAIDLLKRLEEAYEDEPLGRFAAQVTAQVEEDRAVLEGIVARIGSEKSTLKEAAAWVAEKASRAKMGFSKGDVLGVFEGLETLSLGIMGKLALWRALASIACVDKRLEGVDFGSLITRAQSQFNQVEAQRLKAATTALCPER